MTTDDRQAIAPEDQTAWYRKYWQRELVLLALGFGALAVLVLALELYFVVTVPIVSALKAHLH